MRTWFLHPIIFYPLVALLAALVIAVSARPQSWPRTPAAVTGQQVGAALVLEGSSFDAPQPEAQQNLDIPRNFIGQAQSLRIAVLPNQPAPGAGDRGVQILLAPSAAAQLSGHPATIVVNYNPLPVNAATGPGDPPGPVRWVALVAPLALGLVVPLALALGLAAVL